VTPRADLTSPVLDRSHHNRLMAEDRRIEMHNAKMRKVHKTLQAARNKVQSSAALDNSAPSILIREKAGRSEQTALAAFEKVAEAGKNLGGLGSGKVFVLLP
jgi:hypothetical protein